MRNEKIPRYMVCAQVNKKTEVDQLLVRFLDPVFYGDGHRLHLTFPIFFLNLGHKKSAFRGEEYIRGLSNQRFLNLNNKIAGEFVFATNTAKNTKYLMFLFIIRFEFRFQFLLC